MLNGLIRSWKDKASLWEPIVLLTWNMLSFSFQTTLNLLAKEGSLWPLAFRNCITELCIYHNLSSFNKSQLGQHRFFLWASSTTWLQGTAWNYFTYQISGYMQPVMCCCSIPRMCLSQQIQHLQASIMVHIIHGFGQPAGTVGTHQFNDSKMAAKSPVLYKLPR